MLNYAEQYELDRSDDDDEYGDQSVTPWSWMDATALEEMIGRDIGETLEKEPHRLIVSSSKEPHRLIVSSSNLLIIPSSNTIDNTSSPHRPFVSLTHRHSHRHIVSASHSHHPIVAFASAHRCKHVPSSGRLVCARRVRAYVCARVPPCAIGSWQ